MKLLSIMQVNTVPFSSTAYTGYMGLAPFSNSAAIANENIMDQFKDKGWIDHT